MYTFKKYWSAFEHCYAKSSTCVYVIIYVLTQSYFHSFIELSIIPHLE